MLGIIWRRWGETTGKYSSGFEEEFITACNRRKSSKRPEIWLFFKTIDEDSIKYPDEQLKKVLQFKEEQIKRKELLFKEFDNTEKWGDIIYDELVACLADLSLQNSELIA